MGCRHASAFEQPVMTGFENVILLLVEGEFFTCLQLTSCKDSRPNVIMHHPLHSSAIRLVWLVAEPPEVAFISRINISFSSE